MSDRWLTVTFSLYRGIRKKKNNPGDRPILTCWRRKMHYGRRIWRLTFPFHALPPQEAPSFPFLPPSASSSSSSPFGDILTWDASVLDPVTSNLQLRRTLGLRAQSLYSAKYGRTTRDLLIRSKPQVAPHSSKRYRWFCREVYLPSQFAPSISFLALIASFHLPPTFLPL